MAGRAPLGSSNCCEEAKLTDLSELLTGIILTFISIGSLIVCYPRRGKKAWFVGKPFLDPGMSILVVTGFVLGLLLIVAYFTTIDDATLTGVARHS
jgi:hypothetical protein